MGTSLAGGAEGRGLRRCIQVLLVRLGRVKLCDLMHIDGGVNEPGDSNPLFQTNYNWEEIIL